jgi:hypothetical protein
MSDFPEGTAAPEGAQKLVDVCKETWAVIQDFGSFWIFKYPAMDMPFIALFWPDMPFNALFWPDMPLISGARRKNYRGF